MLCVFMPISWNVPLTKKSNCHVLATAWCACGHKAKNHTTLENLHTKKKRKKEKKEKEKEKEKRNGKTKKKQKKNPKEPVLAPLLLSDFTNINFKYGMTVRT